MKKIITILAIILSINSHSQNLDTVNVSLTLRLQDWSWSLGKYGSGSDSVSRARVRQLRTAIIAAAPATMATNVTINNVPGPVVMVIYNTFVYAHFGEIIPMGNNTAERTTIYTNIRAINNSALQYFIGLRDGELSSQFIQTRSSGKAILIDN